jgi:hypothetical protein
MKKINKIERLNYSGGLIGMIFGSTKGKMQDKVTEMNKQGWNLHFINNDQPNLVLWLIRILILVLTFGLWTIGSSEILVFEKEE